MDNNPFQEDKILLTSLQDGNEKAYKELFLKYYSSLCAYAKRFVDLEEGKEIVQDVMVWLWENRKKIQIDISLKSYLFTIVKNKCITSVNRNELKIEIMNVLQQNLPNYNETSDFYLFEELSQKIEEALLSLPETYRKAFEMNRFQNKTYAEIAEQLEISPKTVDYRIQQALKKLRVDLKEYLPLLGFLLQDIT